jgi:hypothetical protein
MSTTYYIEIKNKRQDFRGTKATGKERTTVTRYYTRFNPDPNDFLNVLNNSAWAGMEDSRVRDSATKPISIQVNAGNWDVRLDWTEEWEELEDSPESEVILGLTLYNVNRTYSLPQDRFRQINLSYRIWSGDIDKTSHFQKLGSTKERINIVGTAIGRVDYNTLLNFIKADENVASCGLTYSRDTNSTAVRIDMEVADE